MSKCISMHGEYSDCTPDQNFICKRCTALDEDALFAKVEQLSATIKRVRVLTEDYDLNSGSAYAYVAKDIRAALEPKP